MHHAAMKILDPVVERIKEEMERRELNPLDLSKLAHTSIANTYGIINGTVTPKIEMVDRLAKALKLKVKVSVE